MPESAASPPKGDLTVSVGDPASKRQLPFRPFMLVIYLGEIYNMLVIESGDIYFMLIIYLGEYQFAYAKRNTNNIIE